MDNTEFLLQEIEGLEKSLKEANDIIESLRKMIHVIEKREQVEPIDDPTIPEDINKAMKDIYQWMRKESYSEIVTDFTDHGVLKMSVDLENVEPIKIDLSEVLRTEDLPNTDALHKEEYVKKSDIIDMYENDFPTLDDGVHWSRSDILNNLDAVPSYFM